jgi:hypothetical protein
VPLGRTWKWKEWAYVAAAVVTIVAGVAAVLAFLGWEPSRGADGEAAAPTSSAVLTPSTTSDATGSSQSPTTGATSTTGGQQGQLVAHLLRDLQPTDQDGLQPGPSDVNGQSYPNSVVLYSLQRGDKTYATYVLGRHYEQFHAVVGLDDKSESAASAHVEVLVDGQRTWSKRMKKGQEAEVDLDVANAYELRIAMTCLCGVTAFDWTSTYVVFGDGEVRGRPEEVPPVSLSE